jgi:hypothetical protein
MGCLKLNITYKNPLLKVANSNTFVMKKTEQKFLSIDPRTESNYRSNSFNFALHNLIRFVEPNEKNTISFTNLKIDLNNSKIVLLWEVKN